MIIDTMVMAYAMLGVPEFGEESLAALQAVDEIVAPASVEAELLNVVWQWGLRGDNPQTVAAAYSNASRLWTELIPVETLWPLALELALSSKHSPYDTLFVAAARLRRTRVVTYDKKLLALFPNDAVTTQKI
jgi:predicted nucleic acid-binding protein